MLSIETRNLAKTYDAGRRGATVAVEDLNLAVRAGEVYGLLGPNGAGKTTTIRMLCGLIRPTGGNVTIDGVSLADAANEVRRRVALVPEDAGDFRNLTLAEELDYYGTLYGLNRATVRRRSDHLLDRLGLADRRGARLKTFSRGMRRKFHLVRAVLHEPRVLLLDEPTAGLDPNVVEDVWDLLKGLARDHQVTVILCSHHLEEVERLCDRVGILRRRLLVEGTLAELSGRGRAYRVRLATDPGPQTLDALRALGGVAGVDAANLPSPRDGTNHAISLRLDGDPGAVVPQIVRRLVAMGEDVIEVAPRGRDLRELYRTVVDADAPAAAGEGAPP